ncbi:hypothetical protein CCR97_24170 [Rhodoplanes elegans]|uniref:hypothetical protein n=1 Tax=Rhodoplanes TaxID=29407 RepID=UPI000DABFE38|nr:hypothetical protein [Rhodoplanes elegans]MBK5961277.1 hypothetical protein [Rhodoplanes elegans]
MSVLSQDAKAAKLQALAESAGYTSVDTMLQDRVTDSIAPAICTDPDCSYTTEMEPDQDRGWCEACAKNSVASAFVLAGLI